MALPGDVTVVTLTGTYIDEGGLPASGSLTFIPSVVTLRDQTNDVMIKLRQIRVELTAGGLLSVALLATDDPDLIPGGWHYDVVERLDGYAQRSWVLQLPSTLVTIDVADIPSSVDPSLPVYPAPVFAVTSVVGQVGDVTGVEILADAAISSVLAAKADDTDVIALTAVVATKANDVDLDALTAVVATKADDVDLDALAGVVATKADTSALASLVPYTGATGNVDLGTNSLYADNTPFTEGVVTDPTITDAAGVAVAITSCDVLIRSNSAWGGDERLYRMTVPATSSLALTDNAVNYVYVAWNAGSPVYAVTTDRYTINFSDRVPVARIGMESGSIEYQMMYGYVAKGATSRNQDRVLKTRGRGGIERESGLGISESATRVVSVGSGFAWFGLRRIALDAVTSGVGGTILQLWYHSGGIWTKSTITQYNNTQYDNGTNLATLTANRYAVNWIYRNLITNEIDIILGAGDYTIAQAEASTLPAIPEMVAAFYILCGRIIVQKSASTATAIENVTSTTFNVAAVSNHEDLSGLQGGTAGEYYHLTSAQYTALGVAFSINSGTPTGGGTGTAGQLLYDATYLYICTATNTWKRVPLSVF